MLKPTEENGHCPLRTARDKLMATGLRATRPRLALAWLLFGKGERHVTADELYSEAQRAKVNVSHATVYNVLNSFADAGLVRRFAVTGERSFFDTKLGDHQHFYCEDTGQILDIETGHVAIGQLPEAPRGYAIASVDLVIRLRQTNR